MGEYKVFAGPSDGSARPKHVGHISAATDDEAKDMFHHTMDEKSIARKLSGINKMLGPPASLLNSDLAGLFSLGKNGQELHIQLRNGDNHTIAEHTGTLS